MLSIESIKKAVELLAEKYGLLKVDLFGSYANGTATEKSDADFIVKFNVPVPSIFKVMGLKEELSMFFRQACRYNCNAGFAYKQA